MSNQEEEKLKTKKYQEEYYRENIDRIKKYHKDYAKKNYEKIKLRKYKYLEELSNTKKTIC